VPVAKHLKAANAPLAWTSKLMVAEAYTLHDALIGYVNNEIKLRNTRPGCKSVYKIPEMRQKNSVGFAGYKLVKPAK
jgi:hypothetical protein